MRPAVLAVSAALLSLAALAVLAGALGGTGQRRPERAPAGRTGAQLQFGHAAPAPPGSLRGLRLMRAAVVACLDQAYSGTQQVAWWSRGGSTRYLIQVWHWPAAPEYSESAEPGGDGWQAGTGHAVPGVLNLPGWMLDLIQARYRLGYAGTGSAAGRAAVLVGVWRNDGSPAARFWLDRTTFLPLRRQLFDAAGHLVSDSRYVSLLLGGIDPPEQPTPRAAAWSARPLADSLADLRGQGWPVPGRLGGLELVTLTGTAKGSGSVVDASYSDGLSVVSVFVQRGELAEGLPGWHRTQVDGQVVYAGQPDERSLTWSSRGFVYTVIADAPPATVALVVAGLPHDAQGGGFWSRVGRGLERIGSWFDPFD